MLLRFVRETSTFLVVVLLVIIPAGCTSSSIVSTGNVKTLKVALVVSHSQFCDIDANINHFEQFIKRASQQGARLICFPEMALTSCVMDPAMFDCAEKIPGPSTDRLAQLAGDYNLYISMGTTEKDDTGKCYITQFLCGPNGYIGKYRKHHQAPGGASLGLAEGDSFPVFDIDGFTLGFNICFDGRSWDTIELMKKAGVDIIHHPHGNLLDLGADAEEWTRGKLYYLPARAIYSRSYILVNNSAGDTISPIGTSSFCGGAVIIDPLGQAIVRTTQKDRSEMMVFATLIKPVSALIPQGEVKMNLRYPSSHHPWP